jgi:hypothetical protein
VKVADCSVKRRFTHIYYAATNNVILIFFVKSGDIEHPCPI